MKREDLETIVWGHVTAQWDIIVIISLGSVLSVPMIHLEKNVKKLVNVKRMGPHSVLILTGDVFVSLTGLVQNVAKTVLLVT